MLPKKNCRRIYGNILVFNYKNISSTTGITNELNMGEAQREGEREGGQKKMRKTC